MLSWTNPEILDKNDELNESGTACALWRRGIEVQIDSTEKVTEFNMRPGVYVIIFGPNNQDKKLPINFLYIDCSPFLLKPYRAYAECSIGGGLRMEASVSISKPFLLPADSLKYEPLLLNFKR